MKKLISLQLAAFLISVLFPVIALAGSNDLASLSLPKVLKPEYAPEITALKDDEEAHNPSWNAALYANYVLQLLAGGLLYLAAPVAVTVIALSGFNYVISHGDQTKMDGAKKGLTWAIMGLIFIIISFSLVRALIVLNFSGN